MKAQKMTRREMLKAGIPALAGVALAPGLARAALPPAAPAAELPWPQRRKQIERAWLDLLGDFPTEIPPLKPIMKEVAHEGGITRYHVSFQTESDDRVTAWLLVPDGAKLKRTPAIICIYSTTFGSGKSATAGLAGLRPNDPPEQWIAAYRNPEVGQAFGLDLARHGYVTLSIDMLTDGERITPGGRVMDSRDFYLRHPEWSMVGKNTWDIMRSVDFLQSLDFVDGQHIGCTGWSIGGHSTLFAAAFDQRIAAAIPNGGVLDWHRNVDHWARKPDSWTPWREGDPLGGNPTLERWFGFSPNSGPYVYIKKFRPYIDDPAKPIPTDFDELMMMVAPRPLMIFSSEWEYYSHKILPKCRKALELYMNWRDVDGLPGVMAGRQGRRGYDRTVDYYQYRSGIAPEQLPGQLSQLGAGDCFSWFSFPGGHSTPVAAREISYGWFDRWLGLDPAVT